MSTVAWRVRFADRFLQAQLDAALVDFASGKRIRSIVAAREDGETPFAIHPLPLRPGAREAFVSDGALMLVGEAASACMAGTDLLRVRCDLTPAASAASPNILSALTDAASSPRLA